MTADPNRMIDDMAIEWHVQLRDASAATWEEFEAWLGADPRHLAAYDTMAMLDDDIDDVLATTRPTLSLVASDDPPRRELRKSWLIGGAAATAAAALAAIWTGPQVGPSSRYQVATRAGEQRSVDLGDGTVVAMNGATRITFDRSDRRFARLDEGEAAFSVHHDVARPFALDIGGAKVRDAGTVFNVVRAADRVTVEVREGSVVYDTDADAVPVRAGQVLDAAKGSDRIVIAPKRVESIATWREGRLDYDMQPLTAIARDLERNLGTPVTVDADLAEKRFSGTITLERDHPRFFARLGALLGVKVKHNGVAWRMSAR